MYQATSKSPASCTRQIPQEPHFVPEPADPANCSPPKPADTRLKRPDAQRFQLTFQAGSHTFRRFFRRPRNHPRPVNRTSPKPHPQAAKPIFIGPQSLRNHLSPPDQLHQRPHFAPGTRHPTAPGPQKHPYAALSTFPGPAAAPGTAFRNLTAAWPASAKPHFCSAKTSAAGLCRRVPRQAVRHRRTREIFRHGSQPKIPARR